MHVADDRSDGIIIDIDFKSINLDYLIDIFH